MAKIGGGVTKSNQKRCLEAIKTIVPNHYTFGDSNFTRAYMSYKSHTLGEKHFNAIKRIWEKQEIIVVEGDKTKIGVGNDLLSNALSVKRIIAPAENAFSVYESIRDKILDLYNGELVLLALGPTATVLANELSYYSIQAIDVGHIDIEYEWFLRDAKERIPIPGKYVNEVGDNCYDFEIQNYCYNNQIKARITAQP